MGVKWLTYDIVFHENNISLAMGLNFQILKEHLGSQPERGIDIKPIYVKNGISL